MIRIKTTHKSVKKNYLILLFYEFLVLIENVSIQRDKCLRSSRGVIMSCGTYYYNAWSPIKHSKNKPKDTQACHDNI